MKHRKFIGIIFSILLSMNGLIASGQHIQSIHDTLKKEISQTDSLIRWAGGNTFYRDTRVRLTSSGANKQLQLPVKSAAPYVFSAIKDIEGIRKNLNKHTRSLQLTQSRKDGLSKLEINLSQDKASTELDKFHRIYSPTHHIQTIYHNGKIVSLKDLGMAKADSVMVQASMSLPLSMKSLIIEKEDTVMVFGTDTLDYFWIDEDEFQIDIPLALYPKVLSYQAIDKQGRYMNADSKSSFPLFTVSKEAIQCLRKMNDIRTKCLILNSEKGISEVLSSITQLQKDMERDIKQIYQLCIDGKVETVLSHYMDKPLWTIEEMRIWASYPRFVEKIILCMANREELLKSEHIVHAGNEGKYHIASQPGKDYSSERKQYSLVNDEGEAFISFPDEYLTMFCIDKNYYRGNNVAGYGYNYDYFWLNEQERRLDKLSFDFAFQFNDGSVVGITEGEDGYKRYGVYSNDHWHKELLAPSYEAMWKVGTHLIAINKKEDKADFYDSNLRKLEGMNYRSIPGFGFKTDYMLVSDIINNKKGLLNDQLELSIPCIYTEISELKKGIFYVADEAHRCGVIDSYNRVILPFEYDFIIYSSETPLFPFGKGGKTGYMNREYKEVIPARFDEGYSFVEGYAMVIQGDTYGIIDTKGQYMMKENFTDADRSCNFGFPTRDIVYRINNKRYNYKGDLLK